MQSIKRMVYKPRVDDWSPMAKFYHANEALASVTAELDSFDSRREPDRCNRLVNRLRHCQDRLLQVIDEMLLLVWPRQQDRAPRDYRVKFPDDILQDNLPGQLWFGAECLASGSNIIDHEMESEAIRPLARALVKHLNTLRTMLSDQAIKNPNHYPDKLRRGLQTFDFVLAEFELNYVSAMVPVKSIREYEAQLDITVLFSETIIRAQSEDLISEDQIEMCDPSVMVTLPRLAIICGLLIFPSGPLNVDRDSEEIPLMFRTFHVLLKRIRDLLLVLTKSELNSLERSLASADETPPSKQPITTMQEFKQQQLTNQHPDNVNDNRDTVEGEAGSSRVSTNNEQLRKRSASDNMLISHTQDNTTKQTSRSPSPTSDTDEGRPADVLLDTKLLSPPTQSDALQLVKQNTLKDHATETQGQDHIEHSKLDPATAAKNRQLRSRFRSSEDLVHRLFVSIAGVADQLQVNNPSDLRAVLKMVLQPIEAIDVYEEPGRPSVQTGAEEELGLEASESPQRHSPQTEAAALPQAAVTPGVVRWVPDTEALHCVACAAPFTFTRRRHHCRNCGRIFCAACSANWTPIPELGYDKRVRVCNPCQLYRVNHFSTVTAPTVAHTATTVTQDDSQSTSSTTQAQVNSSS